MTGQHAATALTLALCAALLALFASAAGADQDRNQAVENPPPDIIIVNAAVWTGVKDAADAEAIAITASTITTVGSNDDICALAGPATRVMDAGGRRVIPGITDSHTHILATGLQLTRLDLRQAGGKERFINAVAAATADCPPGKWILGGQYTVESWDKPEEPRKEWIDPVTPGNPVFLTRTDLHQGLANSVALKYARIDRSGPPDPPGGEIERDPGTGEPTGILKDAAMELVSRHIPEPSDKDKYAALILAAKALNAWGITGIHDMTDPDDYDVLLAAHKRGDLTLRVYSFYTAEVFAGSWDRIRQINKSADESFRVAGYKAFMDGSLGSRTAYMHAPYADASPDEKYPRGLRSGQAADLDAFRRQLAWAHDHGMQLAVHAIGDEANHELLDTYASFDGVQRRRYRIEHAQHLLPEDVSRFGKLGVIASMQPLHKADDGRWAEAAIGPERSKTTYAFRSLLDSGATVVFGSDTPVVTANPFEGIAAAVSPRTFDGKIWVPEQSIGREQALRCYTVSPPYAAFAESRLGTLEKGKLADLAILNADVLHAGVESLGAIESWMTMVGGRIVWQAPVAPAH